MRIKIELIERLTRVNLTAYETRVLMAVMLGGNNMSATVIAELIGVDRPNVHRALRGLLNKGFLPIETVSIQTQKECQSRHTKCVDPDTKDCVNPDTPKHECVNPDTSPNGFPPKNPPSLTPIKKPPIIPLRWIELKNEINARAEPPYFPTVQTINNARLVKLKARLKEDPDFLEKCWKAIPICIFYRKADAAAKTTNFSWLDGFWKFLGNNKDGQPILDKILTRSYDHMLPQKPPRTGRIPPPLITQPDDGWGAFREAWEAMTPEQQRHIEGQAAPLCEIKSNEPFYKKELQSHCKTIWEKNRD